MIPLSAGSAWLPFILLFSHVALVLTIIAIIDRKRWLLWFHRHPARCSLATVLVLTLSIPTLLMYGIVVTVLLQWLWRSLLSFLH